MNIQKTDIKDLVIIESEKNTDNRGWFQETYHIDKFRKKNINFVFAQDNLVFSNQNVLRGLHFQKNNPQGKLVSCIKGRIFDVAIDLRQKSDTYKKWMGYFLSEDDNKFIYIPEGFAHGYSVESKEALVHYKCTRCYNSDNEIGIIWNDPDININWPKQEYILSNKDKSNIKLKDLVL